VSLRLEPEQDWEQMCDLVADSTLPWTQRHQIFYGPMWRFQYFLFEVL